MSILNDNYINIVMEDANCNRKSLKKRYEAKLDLVASMVDAFVAYKLN